MKTIKIGLMVFTMLVMVTFSSAQATDKDKVAANKEKTEKLIKHLELSEEQAVKARALNEKYFGLMTNAADATEKKRLNDEADAEAKKLLTEEQYKKYRAYLTAEKNPKQAKSVNRIPSQPRTSN
ncbi:MAG: hypothetical protein HYU68_05245 [Bacteroidetes bacterium]|nr:hypothetical protein [Bacteroidota bacterium]